MAAGDLRAALAQHLIRHLRPAFFPDWRQIDDLGAGGHERITGMQFDELVDVTYFDHASVAFICCGVMIDLASILGFGIASSSLASPRCQPGVLLLWGMIGLASEANSI